MTRSLTALVRALAIAVVAVGLLAPLSGMLFTSLRVEEVVLKDGRVVRAAGAVTETEDEVRLNLPSGAEDLPTDKIAFPRSKVAEIRGAWSTAHYAEIVSSPRTPGLLWNSFRIAGGATILALLLGLPVAWLLVRTRLPARRFVAVLFAGPLLLPPFFAAMGVSTSIGKALAALGLSGGDLQMSSAVVCFGALLFPVVALLAGRAMAAVPAGLVEAAVIQGGRGAAFSRVVLPSVLPSVLCGAAIVFVLALSDFAVPDLLGVFLPKDAVAVHVFATEIFLQWTKYGNTARAVATGAPFMVATLALVVLAAWLARRRPAAFVGAAYRPRPPVALSRLHASLAWLFLAAVLFVCLVLPVKAVADWGFSLARVPTTIGDTERVGEQTLRWLRIGIAAAVLATFTATVLARWALRGGVAIRVLVFAIGALPLAVPAMVMGAGMEQFRVSVPWLSQRFLTPVLAMTARFLPYALAAVWLALRETDTGMEDAARLLGASPSTRALRVWGPLARRGIVAAALLVLVFSLRELDLTVLIEPDVLPNRIYNDVHFGRTGKVADLSMTYLAIVMLPALAVAWVLGRKRRDGPSEPSP